MDDVFEPAFQRKMLGTLLASGYKLALYKNNGGTELTESGYSRQAVSFMVTSLPPILARNSTGVNFGPALEPWPLITHVGLMDPTGVLMFKRKLLTPKTLVLNETLPFPVGVLEVGYA